MRLIDLLSEYSEKGIIPMHMPGHKRSTAFDYLGRLSAELDITEVTDMDNLHGADGILLECMKKAARLWHSKRSFMLVNGSTCGNLAGIRAATTFGGDIIVARNCHKSVYNAIELCGLNPTYIYPKKLNTFDVYGGITPTQIEEALIQAPNARLIVLTSPTYEGVISDIAGICRIAHRRGVAVMVDEAHGAHLDLSPHFTGGAVRAGADIVVQSLHKTLPSLTQTAIMHVNGDIVTAEAIERQLAVFETSSPSYPLMASIDGCVSLLSDSDKRGELFDTWSNNVEQIYEKLSKMQHFRLLTVKSAPEMFGFDSSKIVISTENADISGNVLLFELYERGIECEMAAADYVVAMTGMTDSSEGLERFCAAVLSADDKCGAAVNEGSGILPQEKTENRERTQSGSDPHDKNVHISPKAEIRLSPLTAVMQKRQTTSTVNAVRQVSSEYIWAYPPGIPIVAPGEVITASILTEINYYTEKGVRLHHSLCHDADCIEIVVGY